MLSQKTNKNKNLILEAILFIIVIIIAVFVLKFFVFKNNSLFKGHDNQNGLISQPESFKPLDTSIFKDPKFKSLKDNSAKKVRLEDLNIGREDPFAKPR